MVLIFILKYLSDFHRKTFQIWRSPEGPLMLRDRVSMPLRDDFNEKHPYE